MRVISEFTFHLDEEDRPLATRLSNGAVAIHDITDTAGYSIRFVPCRAHIDAVRACLLRLEQALAEKEKADEAT